MRCARDVVRPEVSPQPSWSRSQTFPNLARVFPRCPQQLRCRPPGTLHRGRTPSEPRTSRRRVTDMSRSPRPVPFAPQHRPVLRRWRLACSCGLPSWRRCPDRRHPTPPGPLAAPPDPGRHRTEEKPKPKPKPSPKPRPVPPTIPWPPFRPIGPFTTPAAARRAIGSAEVTQIIRPVASRDSRRRGTAG